jgi:hypothetical protein
VQVRIASYSHSPENVPRRRVNQDAEEVNRDSSDAIAAASAGTPFGFCAVTASNRVPCVTRFHLFVVLNQQKRPYGCALAKERSIGSLRFMTTTSQS